MRVSTLKFDLQKARAETPGCRHVLHFNNAGMSLKPQPVHDAEIGYLNEELIRGGYETARKRSNEINRVYTAIAELINCTKEEVAVVESATRAWQMAFYSIPFKPGDKILTAMCEYAGNYIPFLHEAGKTGAIIEVIPNDEHGQISLQALENAIDDKAKLIALTHIPTNGGLVNPASAVGEVAKRKGILYLLDACQSAGQIPLDVNEIGCDLLSATSRKYLRGPRGMGFLYVRKALIENLEPPMLDLFSATWVGPDEYKVRSDARRFENWEANYAAKLGLATAVDYALQMDVNVTSERIKMLAKMLREQLNLILSVTIHDLGKEKCGIVSFTAGDKDPAEIQKRLEEQNINVNVSRAPSTLLDMKARNLTSLLRASVHYYNSEEEIERFCTALKPIS